MKISENFIQQKIQKGLQNSINIRKKYVRFNSKGYFYNVQPFSAEYLKAKHAAYNKFRNHENKQNFVYNLPKQTPAIGYYIMKGYKPQISSKNTIQNEQFMNKYLISSSSDTSQKILDNFMKKYLLRRERLKDKNQKKHQKIFSKFQNFLQKPEANINKKCNSRIRAMSINLKSQNLENQSRKRAKTQSSIYILPLPQNKRYFRNICSKATIE